MLTAVLSSQNITDWKSQRNAYVCVVGRQVGDRTSTIRDTLTGICCIVYRDQKSEVGQLLVSVCVRLNVSVEVKGHVRVSISLRIGVSVCIDVSFRGSVGASVRVKVNISVSARVSVGGCCCCPVFVTALR